MPITDINTALEEISRCAINKHMHTISIDISGASLQMINAVREKMKEFPQFVETVYNHKSLIYERR